MIINRHNIGVDLHLVLRVYLTAEAADKWDRRKRANYSCVY